MGSDLYMESQSFRARPNKAQWELVDGELELVIYRDVFYHGWEMIWHGPVTKDNESLIKVMVKEIPEQPPKPVDKKAEIAHLLLGVGPISEAGAKRLADKIMKIVEQEIPDIPVMELKK